MLGATQQAQQSTSCWARFRNRPTFIGGLTVGGIVVVVVCCAGPVAVSAAIGAALGGGVSAGVGGTVGIIVGSTIGGCLLGAGINKCIKNCTGGTRGPVQQETTVVTVVHETDSSAASDVALANPYYSHHPASLLLDLPNSISVGLEWKNAHQEQPEIFQPMYSQRTEDSLVCFHAQSDLSQSEKNQITSGVTTAKP